MAFRHFSMHRDKNMGNGVVSPSPTFRSPSSFQPDWRAQQTLYMGSSPMFFQRQVSLSPQDHRFLPNVPSPGSTYSSSVM